MNPNCRRKVSALARELDERILNSQLSTLLCLFLILSCQFSIVRSQVVLDLDGAVRLAVDSSLATSKYRSEYYASLYKYKSWQASRKPQFSLESTPVTFERYMTQRYISSEDIDVFRQQTIFYSQAGIMATQTMEPWGGQFYGTTQLGYLRASGNQEQTQFMTIPISFGYRQNLLFFNPLKWARQIEPLKMTLAEKQLIYNIECVGEEAVAKFFTLAIAQEQLRMTEEYLASCDTIYAIAERRFKIASIPKAELSILELEKTNARTALANARINRSRAARELAIYLGIEPTSDIQLVIPNTIVTKQVSTANAIEYARENNPQYLASRLTTEEARRDAERARIEKTLSASIDASIGLNQVADRFANAYRHPLSQDLATITLSIPLIDWGKRKNDYLTALSNVESAKSNEKETARDIELDVALTVADLNERQSLVELARQSLTIAEDAYTQTLQRFIKGQSDVYSLSLAQSHWQSARQNQIISLQNYWISYYHLRRLTLHEF